jgi:hypothetical protein
VRRAGERRLSTGDRIFYAVMFLLLAFIAFTMEAGR